MTPGPDGVAGASTDDETATVLVWMLARIDEALAELDADVT